MATTDLCLYDLPNEILVTVLSLFPTESLLHLTVVSRRFHAIILRVLHSRLLLAASLRDRKVILEAWHPARRWTSPFLFCTYLGTDGLSGKYEGEGSLYEDCPTASGRIAKLGSLYSRFRPELPGIEGSMPLRRLGGAPTPAPSALESGRQPIYANSGDGGSRKITHNLNLDADELFCQMCASCSLVRLGPKRGVFLSTVPIVGPTQGVMRVWRHWMRDQARQLRRSEADPTSARLDRTSTSSYPLVGQDTSILWTDYTRNVGLKVAVTSRDDKCYRDDADLEDESLSFSIEIQELVIRTTHLMLSVEESLSDQQNQPGRALIFGSFASIGSAYDA